jgi:hypothetical protein
MLRIFTYVHAVHVSEHWILCTVFVSGLRSFKNVNYNKFTTDWRGARRFPTPDEFNYFKNVLLLSGNKTLLELQQD